MTITRLLQHDGANEASHLLPAQMDVQLLDAIAGKLARWRRGELVDNEERHDVEMFSQQWAAKVLVDFHPGLRDKLYQDDTYVVAFLVAMGELDYLVQQEIVSRKLNYRTYELPESFDRERLRCSIPSYVRCFFRYNGLGPLASDNVLEAMYSSIHDFINSCATAPQLETA